MPLEIATVPCLEDNYAFLLHARDTGETALIDAPEPGPIVTELALRGWSLTEVWLTHHHWDHVDGLPELADRWQPRVVGARADAHRLPKLDLQVGDGITFNFAGHDVHVLDVSGHTINHVAFHVPDARAAFTADSLMALGCGRLFEGTPDQMWHSMQKLAVLPADTIVYSGHEYTQTNAAFAISIEPGNQALVDRVQRVKDTRAKGLPTVPSTLADEMATNPYLRPSSPEIRATLDMQGATDAQVFAEIRRRKDAF